MTTTDAALTSASPRMLDALAASDCFIMPDCVRAVDDWFDKYQSHGEPPTRLVL